jgi:methylmalonyl-CoA mutase N-terminal domain/subunit
VTLALRTQQVLAHETGVTGTADPLGGSYFLERLTDELEADAEAYFRQIAELGGMYGAIEAGFFRREIAEAAFRYQSEVDRRERLIVGMNAFEQAEQGRPELLEIDPATEGRQRARLAQVRSSRDTAAVEQALDAVETAAAGSANLMPPLIEAARARVTLGEQVAALRRCWGTHQISGAW